MWGIGRKQLAHGEEHRHGVNHTGLVTATAAGHLDKALQLLAALLEQGGELCPDNGAEFQDIEQQVRQAGFLGLLEFLEYLLCMVFVDGLPFGDLAKYHTVGQGVLILLRCFLSQDDRRSIHLGGLDIVACGRLALLLTFAIVAGLLQALELHVGYHVVVVFFKNLRNIAEPLQDGEERCIGTGVQVEGGCFGLDEQATDAHGYLCLTGHGGTDEENSGEMAVYRVDIRTESAHDGVQERPLAVVVDAVHLVHQRCPSGKSDAFLLRSLRIDEPSVLLVLVVVLACSDIDLGVRRRVEDGVIVLHQAEFIGIIELPGTIDFVKDAVGKDEAAFFLLAVNLHLQTFREVV